ncbi:hypothetical protein [Methylopila sp. Yamaguchi]|uniref:hypothetical protein n=1 Tax=Methylopila sp. Yamaguchi TaxID=1437817 RepID=UPI000CC4D05F|nr:hypothetical protein [Methylopila sp. Yamaguchi]GBD49852.1 hypothetical protein METY_3065 [Methylopila sp. Yamaguchi]
MIQNDLSPATPSVATLTIPADFELLAKLDGWIAAHLDLMSREEAARALLAAALSGAKTTKHRRPLSGPVDAPMVRAGRKMKAAGARADAAKSGDR